MADELAGHGTVAANPELLGRLYLDKLAPAPDTAPEHFEIGTAAFADLAGLAPGTARSPSTSWDGR